MNGVLHKPCAEKRFWRTLRLDAAQLLEWYFLDTTQQKKKQTNKKNGLIDIVIVTNTKKKTNEVNMQVFLNGSEGRLNFNNIGIFQI